MKAFLRWAGSKKQLLPVLSEYWDGKGTYFEPFAGSSCLFFYLEPTKAVLGDINSELVSTLKAVRNQNAKLLRLLAEMPRGKREYQRIRRVDPSGLHQAEIGARLIFLNHNCFNGLYRTNMSGQFNVPFGRHKKRRTLDTALLKQAGKALRKATLIEGDFEETIKHAQKGDFVYLDPPYFSAKKRIFSEYGPRLFGDDDLCRLQRCLEGLHKRKVRFAVSYWYCKETLELFAKWRIKRVRAKRNIAGFAAARRGAYELIACNFNADGTLID
jgi:DNA adenine methylase